MLLESSSAWVHFKNSKNGPAIRALQKRRFAHWRFYHKCIVI